WFLLYAQVQRVDGLAWRNILLEKTRGALVHNPAGAVIVRDTPYGGASVQSTQIPVSGTFIQSDVENWLKHWQLPVNTPTSVLAVELFNDEANVIRRTFNTAEPRAADTQSQDPLGAHLGTRRILRVSPLTPVRAVC
ncbi:MAG: hypothetical protein JO108_05150, partial [Acidobacteriaceae bacterium]|nr:hypothetical protein [Acidobacteriaceae bacterium]